MTPAIRRARRPARAAGAALPVVVDPPLVVVAVLVVLMVIAPASPCRDRVPSGTCRWSDGVGR